MFGQDPIYGSTGLYGLIGGWFCERPVAGQMKEAGKEAVLAFTGKEEFTLFGNM